MLAFLVPHHTNGAALLMRDNFQHILFYYHYRFVAF
jgi:hypothetical protein